MRSEEIQKELDQTINDSNIKILKLQGALEEAKINEAVVETKPEIEGEIIN